MTNRLVMREGFWRSADETELARPVEGKPWKTKNEFLTRLLAVQGKAHKRAFKGWSTCRICKEHNGSREYSYRDWMWPEGFRHYVEEHNVRPSLAFEEFILDRILGEPK